MKMRFYCQLAFATARLPCIQIRLPSQGRTERGWLQSRLAFVTKWLPLKKGTLDSLSKRSCSVGPLAHALRDREVINKP